MVKWSPLLPFTPDKLRHDEDEETKRCLSLAAPIGISRRLFMHFRAEGFHGMPPEWSCISMQIFQYHHGITYCYGSVGSHQMNLNSQLVLEGHTP